MTLSFSKRFQYTSQNAAPVQYKFDQLTKHISRKNIHNLNGLVSDNNTIAMSSVNKSDTKSKHTRFKSSLYFKKKKSLLLKTGASENCGISAFELYKNVQ